MVFSVKCSNFSWFKRERGKKLKEELEAVQEKLAAHEANNPYTHGSNCLFVCLLFPCHFLYHLGVTKLWLGWMNSLSLVVNWSTLPPFDDVGVVWPYFGDTPCPPLGTSPPFICFFRHPFSSDRQTEMVSTFGRAIRHLIASNCINYQTQITISLYYGRNMDPNTQNTTSSVYDGG